MSSRTLKSCLVALATGFLMAQGPIKYPETRKSEVVDTYHGTLVADPYRWLEDDRSAETAAWVEAQNKVTRAYLEQIPERSAIQARLTRLWDYEKYSAPSKRGDAYFYTHNSGLQNQSVLYVTTSLRDKGRVLLDPNTLSADGTRSLSGMSVSEDGKRLAYAISEGGSDWQVWRVRDVATGKDLPDELRWIKNQGGVTWMKDGSGFYYGRYAAPKAGETLKGMNKFQKLYFHRLGNSQDQDALIYERTDQPEWVFGSSITEDGRWLVISQRQGTERRNRVFIRDLAKADSPIEPLFDRNDAAYAIEGNDQEAFYVWTDLGAARGRLVRVSRTARDPKDWTVLLPEGPGRDVLASVNLVGGRLAATWRIHAQQKVRLYSLAGVFEKEITLPGVGALGNFGGRRRDLESFYSFTSYNQPPTLYRYDFTTGRSEVFRQPKVDLDPTAFEVTQVFYPSKDGTKIPMFLAHRKGLKLDGQNPTLLYGYGGFNISANPGFSAATLAWMEMGGVYAQACLRGGGEYGREWYDAGKLARKQNVFDDFIAAAEWLIANKYTSTPKLAINGGSNGGLLVGACMTQRPELFGACLPAVGVMDMLRYHRFTIGWGWKSDYDVADDPEGFRRLMTYSPLHSLKPGVKYPPTLVTTGDHDDRVVPAHSHKFIATLQACQAGPAPVLTRIETMAGHGAGKPTAKQIAERADQWAFLVKNLGMTLPPGFGK
jgi:prolyl oligopeptidase